MSRGSGYGSATGLTTRRSGRGRIISVEGLDGAGKTTALQALRLRLGDHVLQVREPGGTSLSEVIRQILKGEDLHSDQVIAVGDKAEALLHQVLDISDQPELKQTIERLLDEPDQIKKQSLECQLSAEQELLLFNAARAQLMDEVIDPALSDGQTILMDRFIDSTIAYQGYGRGLDPEYVRESCLQATGGKVPDQTLYLKISPSTRLKRIGGRGEEDRIEASGDDFFTRVAAGFDQMAEQDQRFSTVDAEQSIDQVAAASGDALTGDENTSVEAE